MLDSSALESEIAGSADDLPAILGAPVESFAYLYGRFSVSLRRVVELIYRAAFTCEEGMNDRTTDSCLAIIAILSVAGIALLDEGDHQSSGKLLIARAGEVIWRWPRWGNDSGARGDHNRAPGA